MAEPGSTAEGDLDVFLRLVDAAKDAGASAIKPQWTSSAQRIVERRNAPSYLESYQRLAFPLDYHARISAYAHSLGLQYGVTTFLPGDPALVEPFVDFHKVAAFEAGDWAFITEHFALSKPTFVSTGMLSEKDLAFRRLRENDDKLQLLGCSSAYPCGLDGLNLASICRYGFDGYSDHSHDTRTGGWAVACGARALETHFRLDDCDPANKDYAVAFTPAEFTEYIQNVRDCEAALGDGQKRVQDCERNMERFKVRM